MSRTLPALPYLIHAWAEATHEETARRQARLGRGWPTDEAFRLEDEIRNLTGVRIKRDLSCPDEKDEYFIRRFVMQRMNTLNEQRMNPELRPVIEWSTTHTVTAGRKRARPELSS